MRWNVANVTIRRFLLRAPLLARAQAGDPLLARAIELASPDLAAAPPSEKRARAVERYARRAAFRPTPHGLLAGVAVGELGAATAFTRAPPPPRRA